MSSSSQMMDLECPLLRGSSVRRLRRCAATAFNFVYVLWNLRDLTLGSTGLNVSFFCSLLWPQFVWFSRWLFLRTLKGFLRFLPILVNLETPQTFHRFCRSKYDLQTFFQLPNYRFSATFFFNEGNVSSHFSVHLKKSYYFFPAS